MNETEDVLREEVNVDVFDKLLNLKINSVERIHRLGARQGGKDRPVILRISDFRDKTIILRNCFKLRGKEVSINEDISKRVVEIRRRLWESSDEERKTGAKVKLIFDTMKINDVVYGWNGDTNMRSIWKTPPETPDRRRDGDWRHQNSFNQLKIININVKSIMNKMADLEAVILEHDPDFIVMTETWLKKDILDDEVTPPGYKIVRRDRETRGGGVAILIEDNIQ